MGNWSATNSSKLRQETESLPRKTKGICFIIEFGGPSILQFIQTRLLSMSGVVILNIVKTLP